MVFRNRCSCVMDAAHFLFIIINKPCRVRKVTLCSHLTDGNWKSERGGSPRDTGSELVGDQGLDPAPSHHAVIPTYHGDGWTLASAVSQAGGFSAMILAAQAMDGGATKPPFCKLSCLHWWWQESVRLAEKRGSSRKVRQARRGSLCLTEACPSENQLPVLVKLGLSRWCSSSGWVSGEHLTWGRLFVALVRSVSCLKQSHISSH